MRIRIYGWFVVHPNGTERPATTQEELLQALRDMRDVLLKESDWTQMPDCPLSDEIKNDWRIWRQQLRDITQTVDYPLSYTIGLPIPPVTGRPASWNNWDLNYLETLPEHEENVQQFMDSIQHFLNHEDTQNAEDHTHDGIE